MADPERKCITEEEWEKKLNDVKIRKEDMNKLVMNFLIVEGLVEAAEKFGEESGTQYIDLTTITDRVAIIRAVQCGNIDDAIDKLNVFNREILHGNPRLSYHLEQQRFIELIRNGKVEEALQFARKELALWAIAGEPILEELEFEKTIALLAFEDVYKCPEYDLLDISRRLDIAREVNGAILTSQGHEKGPKLRNLEKMLIWNQHQLYAKVNFF